MTGQSFRSLFAPAAADCATQPTLVVGLTGGIASGKSSVAKLFAAHAITVIDTDDLAREVVAPGSEGLAAITQAFGESLINHAGELDRRALRDRVFASDSDRTVLEQITHPRILKRLEEKIIMAQSPYVVAVVPLLIETGWQAYVDRVLVVDALPSTQRARLIKRDSISTEQAEQMLTSQTDRKTRLAAADEVINNTNHPDALISAVAELDQKYRKLARNKRVFAGFRRNDR
ncbi:MAG: dephospho-CoA kinase [Spiribacter sp.]|jgi:dephospho-CoA kinase|nr:dephospho-CoA kinase [Spiribacter sp.]MDR9489448.1 dephospho-CoA kinase [Spiribacter sp.]